MRTSSFVLILFLLSSVIGRAQTVDNTVNKVNNTLYQADKANETFKKLKGLLPKKKSKNSTADTVASVQVTRVATTSTVNVSAAHVTVMKITGIDYTTLKKLNANIQACEGVQEAKMKFGADSSTIEIKHGGTTDSLLSVIELTSKDIFTDNNITAVEEGSVSIKI